VLEKLVLIMNYSLHPWLRKILVFTLWRNWFALQWYQDERMDAGKKAIFLESCPKKSMQSGLDTVKSRVSGFVPMFIDWQTNKLNLLVELNGDE
jgi:hypothetical protein